MGSVLTLSALTFVSVGGVEVAATSSACVCLTLASLHPLAVGCTGLLSAAPSDLLLFPAQSHLHLHSTVLAVKHWKEIYMEPSRV